MNLQIMPRALIDEGLKRDGDRAVLANIEGQVKAVHRIRRWAGRPEELAEAGEGAYDR